MFFKLKKGFKRGPIDAGSGGPWRRKFKSFNPPYPGEVVKRGRHEPLPYQAAGSRDDS